LLFNIDILFFLAELLLKYSYTGWSRKNTIGDNRFVCCQ